MQSLLFCSNHKDKRPPNRVVFCYATGEVRTPDCNAIGGKLAALLANGGVAAEARFTPSPLAKAASTPRLHQKQRKPNPGFGFRCFYPSRRLGMASSRLARCMELRYSRVWHRAKRVSNLVPCGLIPFRL